MAQDIGYSTSQPLTLPPDDGKGWSPNTWFYIAQPEMLKGKE